MLAKHEVNAWGRPSRKRPSQEAISAAVTGNTDVPGEVSA